jgi:putative peptidoglycan lipid II flippase
LLSRFGGLIRDALLASFLGAGWVADAYITALRIPNMLRDLLGEGALSSVVVSRLGALKGQDGRIKSLIRQLLGFWSLALGGIAFLGICCAPYLVSVIAHGLDSKESYELAVLLTRIIFPYIAIVGMAALTMGVLHHLKVFGWSTSSSSFSNLFMIIWLLLGGSFFQADIVSMSKWVALGVVISGLVQWGSQWPGFVGQNISLKPSFQFVDSELGNITRLLGPSILSVAAVQINVAVNHGFATTIGTGAASSVYFAFRLMQLPVGIVGVAVSTVLLPTLTDHLRENKLDRFGRELGSALVSASFLSIPAVAGLWVLGPEIISMLYERGRFDADASLGVWMALQGFLFGILPYVFNKSLIQAYFALSDTKTPVYISGVSILVNFGVNAYLVFGLGYGVKGLTTGTSCVLLGNFLMLLLGLRHRHGIRLPFLNMLKRWLPMLLFSGLMIYAIAFAQSLQPLQPLQPLVYKGDETGVDSSLVLVFQTLSLTVLGGVTYLGSWFLLKKALKFDFRKL